MLGDYLRESSNWKEFLRKFLSAGNILKQLRKNCSAKELNSFEHKSLLECIRGNSQYTGQLLDSDAGNVLAQSKA